MNKSEIQTMLNALVTSYQKELFGLPQHYMGPFRRSTLVRDTLVDGFRCGLEACYRELESRGLLDLEATQPQLGRPSSGPTMASPGPEATEREPYPGVVTLHAPAPTEEDKARRRIPGGVTFKAQLTGYVQPPPPMPDVLTTDEQVRLQALHVKGYAFETFKCQAGGTPEVWSCWVTDRPEGSPTLKGSTPGEPDFWGTSWACAIRAAIEACEKHAGEC
jgi:hypothetical protein